MTDADIIKITRKIDRLNSKITDLVFELEETLAAEGESTEMVDALRQNFFDNPAMATHVVSRALKGKWHCVNDKRGVVRGLDTSA